MKKVTIAFQASFYSSKVKGEMEEIVQVKEDGNLN